MGVFDDIGDAASDAWDDVKQGAEDVYDAVTGAEVAVENFIDTVIHTVEQAVEDIVDAASDAPGFVENVVDKFKHAAEDKGREMHAILTGEDDRPVFYGVDGDTPEARAKFEADLLMGRAAHIVHNAFGHPHPEHNGDQTPADILIGLLDRTDANQDRGFHFLSDWNKLDSNPISVPAAVMDMTPPTPVHPYELPVAQTDLTTLDGLDASGDKLHFNSNSVATVHDPLSAPANFADTTPQAPAQVYEVPAIHAEHLAFHW